MHERAPVSIMIPDTRQHGGVSQGVQRRKVARTDARAFSISGAPTHPDRDILVFRCTPD